MVPLDAHTIPFLEMLQLLGLLGEHFIYSMVIISLQFYFLHWIVSDSRKALSLARLWKVRSSCYTEGER